MIENYLQVLIESLQKKIMVLDQVEDKNRQQAELLKQENFGLKELDDLSEEKTVFIANLEKLDEGFELLYERIKEELLQNREKYTSEIKKLQSLISLITEKSISIQTMESRNKQLIEAKFRQEREQLHQQKSSTKVAQDYYKVMHQTSFVPPQFLDQKK